MNPTSKPFYLTICILICKCLSIMVAGLHYCIGRAGFIKIPLCIFNAPGGIYKNLQKIWLVRFFRKVVSLLVRSPLRNKTLSLVNLAISFPITGCVIVTCHTPWERLLAQWCIENDFALIIAGGKWPQRILVINKQGKGFRELRELVKHLRFGGRIFIMADVFNNLTDCAVKFLERDYNVSLFPVRLAKKAGVPLITFVPELRNGSIYIYEGPRFDLKILKTDSCAVMQNLLAFFEKEIRRAPSIWSTFVRKSLSKY